MREFLVERGLLAKDEETFYLLLMRTGPGDA
jgi:hypothetical protein